MADDWEKLYLETLTDLKKTGSAFWERINDEQRGIVTQAAKDLAQAEIALLLGRGDPGVHREIVLACKSVLASESALAALEANRRLKEIFQRTVARLLNIGLTLL